MGVDGGASIEGLLSLGQPCSPCFWPLTGVRVQCTVQTAKSGEKTRLNVKTIQCASTGLQLG